MHRSLLATLPAAFLAVACSEPEPTFEPLPTVLEVAHSAGAKLGGVAIGDVLPEHEGPEIVAVCVDGRVIVVHREQDRWRSQVAFQAPGELIQVAVGDLVPSHPGDEILAVGMAEGDEDSGGPGAVWLGVRHRDEGFTGRKILETSALQHAAVIGDIDVNREGLEALVSGFDKRLHLFTVDLVDGELGVGHRDVGTLPGPAKGACLDTRNPNAVLVACGSGSIEAVFLAQGEDSMRSYRSLEHPSGIARPAACTVERTGTRTHFIAGAADDGSLLLDEVTGFDDPLMGPGLLPSHPGREHRESSKLRGVAFIALDDGAEPGALCVSGYEGRVTLYHNNVEDGPEPVTLADTGGALHHLAAGDVRPDIPGDELVAVGYAGEIYVLSR